MNPDGSGLQRIAEGARGDAVWMPDSRTIVYSQSHDPDGLEGNVEPGSFLKRDDVETGASARITKWSEGRADQAPAVSATGLIAFRRQWGARNSDGDIFTVHSDGSNLRRLTQSRAGEGEVVWSPDGTVLAFDRFTYLTLRRYNIFTVSTTDGLIRRVTSTGDAAYPAWSPDGTRISFTRYASWGVDLFVTSAADSGETTRLTRTPDRGETSVQWRPPVP